MTALLGLLLLLFSWSDGLPLSGTCAYTDDVCEFWLVIENTLTMMDDQVLLHPWNGKVYRYDEADLSTAKPIPLEGVVTADGYSKPRVVTLANGTLPGPPIIVYEGQTVIVHIINKLSTDGVTIHWHGLPQKDTPWMDGVAYITQCPIMPGQTFRYEFKATPTGTYWYHSHIGAQRGNGLFGAFIIRDRVPLEVPEHILTIQDWNHDGDSNMNEMLQYHGIYENQKWVPFSESPDGSKFGRLKFHSGLINGRGRFHDHDTKTHNGAPLSVFEVTQGHTVRFRLINTGIVYPFRFSIDEHSLLVIASDGFKIEPIEVDALIIFPGERFDFLLFPSKNVGNYWIRGRTLERDFNHTTEAILHYSGASDESEPTTSSKNCTLASPCRVLNCPMLNLPDSYHFTCITFNQIKAENTKPVTSPSRLSTPPLPEQTKRLNSTKPIKEIFLNFAFPGTTWKPGSVNGRRFEFPSVSGLTQMDEIEPRQLCENADCGPDKVCSCFYSVSIDHGDTVQFVFLNMGNGRGWGHPIHMHGHSFEVLKTGYALHDTYGQIVGDNPDIRCLGQKFGNDTFCNSAEWANKAWENGNVPGMELERPPKKDTIILPSGGYVVVRIQADNPGLWIMHCHVELHSIYGMALVINESYPDVPREPSGFPRCGNFPQSSITKSLSRSKRSDRDDVQSTNRQNDQTATINIQIFSWTVAALSVVTLFEALVIILVCRKNFNMGAKWK